MSLNFFDTNVIPDSSIAEDDIASGGPGGADNSLFFSCTAALFAKASAIHNAKSSIT